MQLGTEPVVLLENGQQVTRKVIQVLFVDLANDCTVDCHVAGVLGFGAVDKNVAWVHIGMKEAVAKHLRKENLHTALGQQLDIDLLAFQGLNIADGHAIYSLTDHDLLAGQRPMHQGHVHQIPGLEVPPQLRGVGCFALQIELTVDNAIVFRDHFHRLQATAAT